MEELILETQELTLEPELLTSYDREESNRRYYIKEGIEQNKKEAAINFHKKGVEDKTIIDALNITKEKLEEYLASDNKTTDI